MCTSMYRYNCPKTQQKYTNYSYFYVYLDRFADTVRGHVSTVSKPTTLRQVFLNIHFAKVKISQHNS